MAAITAPPSTVSIFQYPPNFPAGVVNSQWITWFNAVQANTYVFPAAVAGYAIGWDALGNLVNVPNTGADQTAVLADTTLATNGAGRIGYNGTLSYATGTVGNQVSANVTAIAARLVAADASTYLDQTKGAALIGFNPALTYPGPSVGSRLNDLATASLNTGAALIGYLAPYTGAVGTTQEEVNSRSISAKDFGAVGDCNGTTGNGHDDTAAIQAALDYLGSNGGGVVNLPFSSGGYRITAGIKIPAYVTLRGHTFASYPYGRSDIYLDFSNANQWGVDTKTLQGGVAVAYDALLAYTLPTTPAYNACLENCCIQSIGSATPYGAIRMQGAPGSRIYGVATAGTGTGVLINDCWDGEYRANVQALYYGWRAWEIGNCDLAIVANCSPYSATVPAGYLCPNMNSFATTLVSNYGLATNAHYNRSWGAILGAVGATPCPANTLTTDIESFNGGLFLMNAGGETIRNLYVEAITGYTLVAAGNSRFIVTGSSFPGPANASIFCDIGSGVLCDVSLGGNFNFTTFGTIYNTSGALSGPAWVRLKGNTLFTLQAPKQTNVWVTDDPLGYAWTNVTGGFFGGWTNGTTWLGGSGATLSALGYRKNPATGLVELRGSIVGNPTGTMGIAAFALPAGFRPSSAHVFACLSGLVLGAVQVSSDGGVIPQVGSTTNGIVLDGITFQAEV